MDQELSSVLHLVFVPSHMRAALRISDIYSLLRDRPSQISCKSRVPSVLKIVMILSVSSHLMLHTMHLVWAALIFLHQLLPTILSPLKDSEKSRKFSKSYSLSDNSGTSSTAPALSNKKWIYRIWLISNASRFPPEDMGHSNAIMMDRRPLLRIPISFAILHLVPLTSSVKRFVAQLGHKNMFRHTWLQSVIPQNIPFLVTMIFLTVLLPMLCSSIPWVFV